MKSQPHSSDLSGNSSEDEAQRENRFEERIHFGERIEPKDWMPERYRRTKIPTNDRLRINLTNNLFSFFMIKYI